MTGRPMKTNWLQKLALAGVCLAVALSLSGCNEDEGSAACTGAEATFTSIKSTIFSEKCLSCHSTSGGNQGSINLETYASVLNTLSPGSPDSSSLYTSVNTGSMPQGSLKLCASDIEAIQNWIQNGAQNN